jgi:hypothetical protein
MNDNLPSVELPELATQDRLGGKRAPKSSADTAATLSNPKAGKDKALNLS